MGSSRLVTPQPRLFAMMDGVMGDSIENNLLKMDKLKELLICIII